ncbi:hypothetical protein QBC38DRAFT_541260 [Podospora fimiseda]|uniref:Zn(2)-C6 fungal-type domain-containing protein n=1 Tax=Podospora fimiseda TaxID=252190 RepID=A0AAN7BXT9_9PEZI|nr:hypothetical protein QBC38DRAFT_541260 [Podospora fimiseda]
MPSSSTSTVVRQQPGYACEECRRRKARCDRVRPQCGFCVETGTACVIIEKRPQRGPKRGQLSAMRSRIATLERQLCERQGLAAFHDPSTGMMGDPSVPVPASAISVLSEPHAPVADMEVEHRGSVGDDARHYGSYAGMSRNFSFTGSTTSEAPSIISGASSSINSAATSILTSQDTVALSLWTDMNWQDVDCTSSSLSMMQPCSVSPMMDISHMHAIGHHNAYAGAGTSPTNPLRRDSENLEMIISDLMRTDLDQLYFERVHPVIPMLHQRRYFSWADEENPSPPRAGLRSAMRAIAAAMSAQFRSLADCLYQETLRLLEVRNQTPTATEGMEMPLEQIQAWLLLAHYEILRVNEHQAMLTAGRAFRLVQMARLYELDRDDKTDSDGNNTTASSPGVPQSPTLPDEEFAEVEEKRRIFWLAYSLDRFLCSRNDWPLTLHEEMVRTRLPAPETNFQLGKRVRVGFLQDTLDVMGQMACSSGPLSPFAETVVLATLQARCMDHRRSSRNNVTLTESGVTGAQPDHDFWVCHEWLTSVVEKRVQILSQIQGPVTDGGFGHGSSSGVDGDPMLLFARMLAYGALVHLNTTLQAIRSPWQTPEHQLMTTTAGWRADRAAAEMVRLARSVKVFSCFKVHPFLADPLECATGFLLGKQQAKANEGIFNFDAEGQGLADDGGVEHLLRVLRYLGDTSSLARDLLSRLGISIQRAGVKAFSQEMDFASSIAWKG